MSLIFTDGLLILVEGDKKNEWFNAKIWQAEEFIKAMKFGTMKSMCYPNPYVQTKIFNSPNNCQYRFHIYNDWGPVYIENINTKKKREIKYFEIFRSKSETPKFELSNIKKNNK